jgi:glutaminase
MESIAITIQKIHQACCNINYGKIVDYIPELADCNPSLFGIAIATSDGQIYYTGDAKFKFPIESLCKPFVYGVALEDHGRDTMMNKVGVCISGLPFNSIIDSGIRRTKLQNPLGNAGAMATASLIKGFSSQEKWERVRESIGNYIGRTPEVNHKIYRSEMSTNSRNRALAHLYKSYNLFYDDVDSTISRYTKACSLMIDTTELAIMGASLANNGKNPLTGTQAISPEHVRDILSIMLINGLYDGTGNWIFDVGLPGKSGVGGGLLAIVPKRFSIATFSPLLDDAGNSIRGMSAIKRLVNQWQLHLLS